MAVDPKDLSRLHDMLEAARIVMEYIAGMSCEQFVADGRSVDAVERRIEIIGEAARFVSTEFSSAHPEIPWQLIIKQRHVLAHDYARIDRARIYRVAKEYVPELVRQLEPLVRPHTDSSSTETEQE